MYKMFLEKADAALGNGNRSNTGVLLVGHGQPDEWDAMWPTETEHEVAFRQSILDKLVEGGYKKENVALAWMEFKEPKPAEKVEAMVANGVEKVLYFSAAISADSIHSQYDVPELMHEAKVPDGFEMTNLGAWNDHPLVIQAIMEKVIGSIVEFEGGARGGRFYCNLQPLKSCSFTGSLVLRFCQASNILPLNMSLKCADLIPLGHSL